MKVKLSNGIEYTYKWNHHNNCNVRTILYHKQEELRSWTECWAEMEGKQIAREKSYLSLKDTNYNKDLGRKYALKRLIRFMDKKDRTLVWMAYHKMCNHKYKNLEKV